MNNDVNPRDAADALAPLERSSGRLSYLEMGALRVLIDHARSVDRERVADTRRLLAAMTIEAEEDGDLFTAQTYGCLAARLTEALFEDAS